MKKIVLILVLICFSAFCMTGCTCSSNEADNKAAVEPAKDIKSDATQAGEVKSGSPAETAKDAGAAATEATKEAASDSAAATVEAGQENAADTAKMVKEEEKPAAEKTNE